MVQNKKHELKSKTLDDLGRLYDSKQLKARTSGDIEGNDLKDEKYVQEALHKEVLYSVEGKTKLSDPMIRAFKFVKENFIIPRMFDKRHRYGPLSGTSAEERLIIAYMHKQLEPKKGHETAVNIKVCINCGEQGHFACTCTM